jgi:putative DNA primase/helicase
MATELPINITKSPNIVNVRMAVMKDFGGHLRYNIFTHDVEYDDRTLETDDLNNIKHDLCKQYEFEASADNITASTIYVAKLRSYHPVKAFIETDKWDGVSRIDRFFLDYFKCEDQPELYLKTVARYFLIGAVARIYNPGCKIDTMPVIQSTQGWYKSATLKQLFGGFFTDEMGSIQQKDDLIKMTKVWGVEFSELTGLKRADKNHQKQFLTMTEDTVRKPYERLAKTYLRQSVFVCTTNDDEYLSDAENRRFMPLTMVGVDRTLLSDNLTQLWAEALHRYKQGEAWWHERESVEMVELFAEQTQERQLMNANGTMFKVNAWTE